MNEARDLQHPEIAQIEKTGYPWFPRKVTIEATEEDAKAYCQYSYDAFFNFLLATYPHAVNSYLDDNEDLFDEFVVRHVQ